MKYLGSSTSYYKTSLQDTIQFLELDHFLENRSSDSLPVGVVSIDHVYSCVLQDHNFLHYPVFGIGRHHYHYI